MIQKKDVRFELLLDERTMRMLEMLAQADDRSRASMVRCLIKDAALKRGILPAITGPRSLTVNSRT